MEFIKMEKLFYMIISGCAIICSTFMIKLSDSVDRLNVSMAVITQTVLIHDDKIKSVENKLDVINERVRR